MGRIKSQELLLAVIPVADVKKGRAAALSCTPDRWCTNFSPTMRAAVRVSKKDLDALRRVLTALQRRPSRKKK